MGDSYALEILRKHFQTRLAEGVFKFIVDSYEVFFLTEHGGRAEWETVVKYADAQLTGGEAGGGQFIWSDIVYSNEAATSPYAIPGLALAVTKGRHSQHGPAPAPTKDGQQLPRHELHVAWKAANLLQRLTGEKFGITDAETSVSEMQASLDKVQSWWEADGRIKFSFDEIERSVGARKTEK